MHAEGVKWGSDWIVLRYLVRVVGENEVNGLCFFHAPRYILNERNKRSLLRSTEINKTTNDKISLWHFLLSTANRNERVSERGVERSKEDNKNCNEFDDMPTTFVVKYWHDYLLKRAKRRKKMCRQNFLLRLCSRARRRGNFDCIRHSAILNDLRNFGNVRVKLFATKREIATSRMECESCSLCFL